MIAQQTPETINYDPSNYEYHSQDITIIDGAIQNNTSLNEPIRKTSERLPISNSGRHSTRAEKQISSQALQTYLTSKGSPLAPYADQIANSPFASTIIGICTIEQYGCTKAPFNNYFGLMSGGKLIRFKDIPEAIEYESKFLDKAYNNGHDTVEKLNCYYVVPCSNAWLSTVIRVKIEVESL